MYAIFKSGSKQYKVQEGDVICVDKLGLNPKDKVELKEVLAIGGGELKVGTPYLDGAIIEAEVVNEGKERKIIVFKKRRRKDSKLKKGFRRAFTRLKITKIAS